MSKKLITGEKFWIFLTITITIFAYSSLIRPGFLPMQDDLQAFRIQQMGKCLADWQIPCRWIPDMGYQYGYPQFNFYGPTPYYIGALLHLLNIQIIDAVKILFIAGFVFSALSMYLLLRSFTTSFAALVGAVVYTFAPFKAAQVYVRGSLSEFLSFIFLPLLFWSSRQMIVSSAKRYIFYFAISLSLLITTHNLTTFIFLPFLLIWIVINLVIEKNWLALKRVTFAGLLGGGLAAFYILPLIFERKFVHLETLLSGYFDYRQHFVAIGQLLWSNYFAYGQSEFGLGDTVTLSTGVVLVGLSIISAAVAALTYRKNRLMAKMLIGSLILAVFSLIMMHEKSALIWRLVVPLQFLQFPWRFLTLSVFLLSLASGIGVYLVSKLNRKLGFAYGVITILAVLFMHASFFQPKSWLDITDYDKFSGESWEKQLTISIFDYLPIYAQFPPVTKAPYLPEVLKGQLVFESYQKGSNYQEGIVDVLVDATVRVPIFDFPGMSVYIDGQKVDHVNNICTGQKFCLGLVTFDVPKGKHSVKVVLENTPVRTIGNLVTIISLLFCMIWIGKYGFNQNNKK